MLLRRLDGAQERYDELIAGLTAAQLGLKLGDLPSSTIGQQLWCVVGARESYRRAAEAGSWQGFDASLTSADLDDPARVRAVFARSHQGTHAFIAGLDPDDAYALELAFGLLEHETMHHGQLIRYLYGDRIPIPPGWKEHYVLD
ncbi:hypothetical protein GCM10025738_24620 [Microbacterium fluvii]